MDKSKVLEDFLGDKVEKLKSGVFRWRSLFYQVEYYPAILRNKKLKASHFIVYEYNGRRYGIRELSDKVLQKLLLDK